MAYGDKRDYPKIDIYVRRSPGGREFDWIGVTTWAATCREAREQYAERNGIDVKNVRAFFRKD